MTRVPHPIYTKALADLDRHPTWAYVSPADTARLVRDALHRDYPATKFYVRTDVYSGGASIDVWYDGTAPGAPASTRDVDRVLGAFSGGGFDGMIDMAYDKKSWLYPDGTAGFGSSSGTWGSRGSVPGWDHAPTKTGAIPVHFGAHYIFVSDDLPYDVRSRKGA